MPNPAVDQLTAFTVDDPILADVRAGRLPEIAYIDAAIITRDRAVVRFMREIAELRKARVRALRAMRLP